MTWAVIVMLLLVLLVRVIIVAVSTATAAVPASVVLVVCTSIASVVFAPALLVVLALRGATSVLIVGERARSVAATAAAARLVVVAANRLLAFARADLVVQPIALKRIRAVHPGGPKATTADGSDRSVDTLVLGTRAKVAAGPRGSRLARGSLVAMAPALAPPQTTAESNEGQNCGASNSDTNDLAEAKLGGRAAASLGEGGCEFGAVDSRGKRDECRPELRSEGDVASASGGSSHHDQLAMAWHATDGDVEEGRARHKEAVHSLSVGQRVDHVGDRGVIVNGVGVVEVDGALPHVHGVGGETGTNDGKLGVGCLGVGRVTHKGTVDGNVERTAAVQHRIGHALWVRAWRVPVRRVPLFNLVGGVESLRRGAGGHVERNILMRVGTCNHDGTIGEQNSARVVETSNGGRLEISTGETLTSGLGRVINDGNVSGILRKTFGVDGATVVLDGVPCLVRIAGSSLLGAVEDDHGTVREVDELSHGTTFGKPPLLDVLSVSDLVALIVLGVDGRAVIRSLETENVATGTTVVAPHLVAHDTTTAKQDGRCVLILRSEWQHGSGSRGGVDAHDSARHVGKVDLSVVDVVPEDGTDVGLHEDLARGHEVGVRVHVETVSLSHKVTDG